jgi:hypothetical protein
MFSSQEVQTIKSLHRLKKSKELFGKGNNQEKKMNYEHNSK